ncbi:MAG: carboxylating nicotinate-nucleotide diphosphorylase [Nitrososphaerales archaeon]
MNPLIKDLLMKFVEEDAPWGDITTHLIVDPKTEARASLIAKTDGVFAGSEEVETLSSLFNLSSKLNLKDGERFKAQSVLGEITGKAKDILLIERTLLNLLSHMCGVATATKNIVDLLRANGLYTRIAATRKTHPGLRLFEKKAVLAGGGDPHRMDLSSMILIKDNHIALCGGVGEAVKKVRSGSSFSMKIEVEVKSLDEALEAIEAGADIVMFDNLSSDDVKQVVDALKRRGLREKVLLEASGGINYSNVLNYAMAGVDIISMGSLTSTPQHIDISLELEPI